MFLSFNKNKFNEEFKDIVEKRRKDRQELQKMLLPYMKKYYPRYYKKLLKKQSKKSRG